MEDGPESQEISNSKMDEDCWAKIVSWFREYDLQRKQGTQESQTKQEEMRQQQRMKVMTDLTRHNNSKGRMDANNSWVSELLVADCHKAKTGGGCDVFHPKVPLGFDKRNKRRSGACTTVFFVIPKNITSERQFPIIVLNGMPLMGEMEELIERCGKICWIRKGSNTRQENRIFHS